MDGEICLAKGLLEKLNMAKSSLSYEAIGKSKYEIETDSLDYEAALKLAIDALLDLNHGVINSIDEITAVGHRVVHGAEKFSQSTIITEAVEATIRECFPLAPLHNPPNLMGISACKRILPNIPHVAVFDTAFHQTMPEQAYLYAIPYQLYAEHSIRRYGFHGTSHRYVTNRATQLLGQAPESLKIITCHLGNGCSITAVNEGKSVDTSMGLTPLEGLVMGTRSGDLDPAVVFFLMDRLGMSSNQVDDLLNKQSGLLGLSGNSRDVRDLIEASKNGDKRSKLALNIFCYRVRKYIGAYAAAMGGLDAVIFTAGIGENAVEIRQNICEGLEFMGIELDKEKNKSKESEKFINTENSKVKILVIPTNEELLIARDTLEIVSGLYTESTGKE
jgi:acetate kinase